MEFYKEGKILGLTGSTRLDLNGSGTNHKGILISRIAVNGPVKLYFNSKGNVGGLTYAFVCTCDMPNNIAGTVIGTQEVILDNMLPFRLAAVEPTTGLTTTTVGKVILFN
jgi:hypothetical protein